MSKVRGTRVMALMLRIISATSGVCALSFLAGCVVHETYGDHALPEGELAVVEGYWRYQFLYDEELHIVSVDGKPAGGRIGWPYAYSVSLPPGLHWLQIAILRNGGDVAKCAFEWTFEARHRYKLKRLHHDQALLAHPLSSPFAASISIAAAAPARPDQFSSAPAVCSTGPVCRQNSDCSPNHSCQFDAGFEFGTCKPLDR